MSTGRESSLDKDILTNPIVLGPQHAGIAIVGLGSPLQRFVDTGGGAALYLKDGANADVISIVGVRGDRIPITLDSFKINGNKRNNTAGCGIRMFQVKDVLIGRLFIEDCAEHGFQAGEPNGNSNQLIVDYLEVQNCNGRGLNLGSLADSNFNVCTAAQCGDIGMYLSGSNLKFGRLRAYLNHNAGVNVAGKNCFVSEVHANENDRAGLRLVGKLNRVVSALCYNNGKDPQTGVLDDKAGIYIHHKARKNWIGHKVTYDDQDGSQTIGIQRDDDAASENTIGVGVTGA